MLTRATRGVRNQAQEMINNLHIIQYAIRHSLDRTMNTDLAYFIASRLTAPRHLKTTKHVYPHHKSKSEDTSVRLLFPKSHIVYYQTLRIGNLRLSTRSYSNGKIADDSNIIFRLNGNENFGRIRAIITVDGREPLVFVAHLSNCLSLVYPIDDLENLSYDNIQNSSQLHWSFVLIEVNDIVEKSVFYDCPSGRCTFFRFPNLTHCS